MLKLARQQVPRASFAQMDFNELTFPAASFDVILASHALLFAAIASPPSPSGAA